MAGSPSQKFSRDVTCALSGSNGRRYEPLIEQCKNDKKDRHVLACAIHCQAEVIVTFNLRHFPEETLKPWNITAVHPQDQLLSLYGLEQQLGLYKLTQIANRKQVDLKD